MFALDRRPPSLLPNFSEGPGIPRKVVIYDSQAVIDDYFPGYARTFTKIGKERGWPPVKREHFDAQMAPLGSMLIGNPEEVAAKILRHSEALGGIERVSFQMDNAGLSHEKLMQSIDLIGQKVAPIVKAFRN